MPLYDILNEFQKGSHMVAVTKVQGKLDGSPSEELQADQQPLETDSSSEADLEKGELVDESLRVLRKAKKIDEGELHGHVNAGEVIGIITLEDVMEELLQVTLPRIFHKRASLYQSSSRIAQELLKNNQFNNFFDLFHPYFKRGKDVKYG